MLALSLLAPWPWAILEGFKPLENRDWRPAPKIIGERFAIHTSKSTTDLLNPEVRRFIAARTGGRLWKPEEIILGAVVGTAKLVRVVKESDDPWFTGKYGFELAEVRKLATPIACRGALGFWRLPPEIQAQVLVQDAANAA